MFKWKKHKSSPTSISEAEVLRGGVSTAGQGMARQLESLLDQVIALFAPAQSVMAEVLITLPDMSQLVTVELRPQTTTALYMRLRAGEGLVGKVLQTGRPLVIALQGESAQPADLKAVDQFHLLSTKSALAYPLMPGSPVAGVLNLESPRPSAFPASAVAQLEESGIIPQLVTELAEVTPERLSADSVVEDLLVRMRQRIAFAASSDDMTETYYQILRVAGQVVRPTNVSGGLILVRDEQQNLSGVGKGASKLYAVRAAKTGAFNSDPEWELAGQSIARRVITNRQSAILDDAQSDPDYRNSGTGLEKTSELIVPVSAELVEGDRAVGVIGLVSPGIGAFNAEDLRHLEEVAAIAGFAIKRSEEYRQNKRQREQLECANAVLETLSSLFPQNMRDVTMEEIERTRGAVSDLILTWAVEKTASEHGVFVLAETTEQQQGYLVIREKKTATGVTEGVEDRWLATQGITGTAYSERRLVYEPDTSKVPAFIPYFEGVQSEVATPLRIGDTALGVLDVESNAAHHFTSDHLQWIEFLATQAAFALTTINRAGEMCIELALADLSQQIDVGIAEMRTLRDLQEVRDRRYDLVRLAIDTLRPLTRAWVGRFLIGLNPYTNGDHSRVDTRRGALFYLVSTDEREETDRETRFFPLMLGSRARGVSSKAFIEQRRIVFNDRLSRPPEYFDSDPQRDSPAGVFVPVWEGTRISGILNIESRYVGAFTQEVVRAIEVAGTLISKVVTASRLRIMELLRDRLREFEHEILKQQSADLNGFMTQVLARAGTLSSIAGGWGLVLQLRQPFGEAAPIADRLFWMAYAEQPKRLHVFDDEKPVEYAVMLEAMRSRQPVLILDRRMQPDDEHRGEPWPQETRSVICVPLLRPTEVDGATNVEAIGVLALAHPNIAEFSEFDKEILTLFSESVIVGLKGISLLQARKELMRQVRHDFSQAVTPLSLDAETVKRRLGLVMEAPDLDTAKRLLQGVAEITSRRDAFVFLLTDLMTWFFDLSNDQLLLEDDAGEVETLQAVLEVQRNPIDALAYAVKHRTVNWDLHPDDPMPILGGERRGRLIRAALFQYLDNAIKYGEGSSIDVEVVRASEGAVVAVKTMGEPLPELEWESVFDLSYRGSNVTEDTSGSGIGLFQVREIARRLGGRAWYRPAPTVPRRNVFYLSVPLV